jgi:hypothetical protein
MQIFCSWPTDQLPAYLLPWHARLVRQHWTYPGKPVRVLVLEMARDTPGWGYRRNHGELAGSAYRLVLPVVRQTLKDAGVDAGPDDPGRPGVHSGFPAKTILAAVSSTSAPCSCGACRCCSSPGTTAPAAPTRDHRSSDEEQAYAVWWTLQAPPPSQEGDACRAG